MKKKIKQYFLKIKKFLELFAKNQGFKIEKLDSEIVYLQTLKMLKIFEKDVI